MTASDNQLRHAVQLTLLDVSQSGLQPQPRRTKPMRVADLSRWAGRTARTLARSVRRHGGDRDELLLTQTIKLGEEVGELYAEVLGRVSLQRADKAHRYTEASMRGELADVAICVAIIADLAGVDLEQALVEKMAVIDDRLRSAAARSTG